jgi:hypothetical protein
MIFSILDKCLLAIELLAGKSGSMEGGLEKTNTFVLITVVSIMLMQRSIDDTANANIMILCCLLTLDLNHDKNL